VNKLRWLRDKLARRTRRAYWQRKWTRADYYPDWLCDGPREQVVAACRDGWLAPGGSLLDIGCGNGNTANWLASEGFTVTGIDLAAGAIARARQARPTPNNPRFETADVTGTVPLRTPFDMLIDLGCLHQLPREMWQSYRSNLLEWSLPGSRLLLLMKTRSSTPDAAAVDIGSFLSPDFRIIAITETNLAARPEAPVRHGLCVRAERL
jgi:cyclopropane fatty-acyl-phospholipid synthase-like methyltransferase